MSIFKQVEIPPDPTLILNKLYLEDSSKDKVNLGVGAYRDDDGKPWILPSVSQAHNVITDQSSKYNHEYPPQGGFKDFLEVSQNFLLGEGHQAIKENRVASCQSLSGTGSLYILFEFIHQTLPDADLHIPATTWANHFGIYTHVYGKAPNKYPYFDAKTGKLDYDNFISYLKNLKDGEIILLQAVAQNPSGVDPSREQWQGILEAMKAKKHIALFDNAYQGFATGSFEDDGFAIRLFADAGLEIMIAQSFAKNFGLYGERVGCAHVIHNKKNDATFTANIQAQLAKLVRVSWSLSPVYGANIIRVIGGNKEFYKQFLNDVKTMADRIKSMRELLYQKLMDLKAEGNWEVIKTNIGMFSLTPLNKNQVIYLREKHHIYLVENGRMSMSGVNSKNVEKVAQAFVDAMKNIQ